MDFESLKKTIGKKFTTSKWENTFDTISFRSDDKINLKVLRFLKEHLDFALLVDLCGVHYPDDKALAVVYHLMNLEKNIRLRYQVSVSEDKPEVFTATSLFESANWMERETYDFFGINFIGHPNLKRILNVDEMDYYPLLKQYPLEDQTRKDKDDEMFGRGSKQYDEAIINKIES